MNSNPEREWFGNTKVSSDEKTEKVIGVFRNVAKRYDIMNDVMSAGLHRCWKDHLIRKIRPRPHYKYLDVAGGTGDIAFRIHRKLRTYNDSSFSKRDFPAKAGISSETISQIPAFAGKAKEEKNTQITVCDLNADMLRVGEERAIDQGITDIEWKQGNAEKLPFEDNRFDIYTISFGLRNVTHIDTALREAHRVLKPGGRFYCMEFSHVDDPLVSRLYDQYSKLIPVMGNLIAKDRESYQYLIESIQQFPRPKNLSERLGKQGFIKTRFELLQFGVVAIHEGLKI